VPSSLPGLRGLVAQGLSGRRKPSGVQARVIYANSTDKVPVYNIKGVIIPAGDGAASDFAYLAPAILPRTGRWYWEAKILQSTNWFLWGLAFNITALAYGGYNTINCGFYSTGSLWTGSGTSSASGWLGSGLAVSDVLGFLYNSETAQFDIYQNGSLAGTITNIPYAPAYPLFAFQGLAVAAEVRLGADNVQYKPYPDLSYDV